jgi:hypothetical protein
MHIRYWWEIQKERDHWENQDIDGRTILKYILERYVEVVWIGLMWLRIGNGGGSCDHDNEPSGYIKCWEVLQWLHFSRRAQLREVAYLVS